MGRRSKSVTTSVVDDVVSSPDSDTSGYLGGLQLDSWSDAEVQAFSDWHIENGGTTGNLENASRGQLKKMVRDFEQESSADDNDTAPTEPTPAEPTPSEPTPTGSMPTEPTPTEPTPIEPTPSEPVGETAGSPSAPEPSQDETQTEATGPEPTPPLDPAPEEGTSGETSQEPVEPAPPLAVVPENAIYVAVGGSDDATGTENDPLASIQQAIRMSQPGDTIVVREGTYHGIVDVWAGGEAGAELTIMGYPGERPIIDGTGTPPKTSLVVISAPHVVFEGFEVMNATGSGISVWSTSNATIRNNVVHDTYKGGIYIGSDQLGISTGHLIEDNVVYNTCLMNEDRDMNGGWPRGIGLDVSTDTVVADNVSFANYGEGIGALSSSDVEIINNIVYDNFSVQIYLDNTQDMLVTGNTVFHTGDEEFFRDGRPGRGIMIANEYTTYEMATREVIVQDNTYAGVDTVFYNDSYGWGGGIEDSILGPGYIVSADNIDPSWISDVPFA